MDITMDATTDTTGATGPGAATGAEVGPAVDSPADAHGPAPPIEPDTESPYWCGYCKAIQSKKYNRHYKVKHQATTTVKFGGESVDVHRDKSTNLFRCPRCTEEKEDPFALQRHAFSKCQGAAGPSAPAAAANAAEPDQPGPSQRRHVRARSTTDAAPAPEQEAVAQRVLFPPGEHIVTDDEHFKRLSIFVDKESSRIGCLNCCKTIQPRYLNEHLHDKHKLRGFPNKIGSMIQKRYNIIKTDVISRPAQVPCAPVFGLEIWEKMVFCGHCAHGFTTSKSLATHHHLKHSPAPPLTREETHGQTFFRGKSRSYFPVTVLAPPLPSLSDDFDLFLRDRPVYVPADQPIHQPENHRQLSVFLTDQTWMDHVEGLRPSDIVGLIQIPQDSVVYRGLLPHVKRWFYNSQPIVNTMDDNVIVRISQCGIDEFHTKHRLSGFHEKTSDKYAAVIAALFVFVMRGAKGELGEYDMHLKDDIVAAANAIDEELELWADAHANEEEYEVDGNLWDGLIQDLGYALVAHRKGPMEDSRWFSPVIRFIVLHSVTPAGDFQYPNQITQTFAQVVWFARACLVRHINDLQHDESRAEEDRDIHKLCDDIVPYFSLLRYSTPMSYILSAWKKIGSLASVEEGLPKLATTNLQGDDVIVDGVRITKQNLVDGVKKVVADYKQVLYGDVLLGLDPDLFKIPKEDFVHDNNRDGTPGYSYIDDKRNHYHKMQDALIREYLTNPALANRLHYIDNGKVAWISGAVRKILEAEDLSSGLLVIIITMTSGAPGRAEEIAAMTVRNVPCGTIRNLLVIRGFRGFVAGYVKNAKKNRKQKATPRVLVDEVADMVDFHLAVVRPAMRTLVQIIEMSTATIERYQFSLWPGLDRLTLGPDVSKVLFEMTEKYLGVGMAVLMYRHFAKTLDRNIRDPGNVKHWNDDQGGHTSDMAQRFYGITLQIISSLSDERIIGCFRASAAWHAMFSCYKLKKYLEDSGFTGVSQDVSSSSAPPVDVLALAQNLRQLTIEDLKQAVALAVHNNVAQAAAIWFPPPPLAPSVRLVSQPTHLLHPSALAKLRRFTDNPNATFKSSTQAIALEAITSLQYNYLIVASTGLGKTFLAMLIAKEFEPEGTTIVVLPLRSLHYDFKRRCAASGVYALQWNWKNQSPDAPIVYVSVEDSQAEGFKIFCRTLVLQGRLTRFWIDEAHLALTHQSFRTVFNELSTLTERPVPIVLTTATCPPFLEEKLWSVFRSTTHRTIRGPTDRPEARDRYIEVPKDEMLEKLKKELDKRKKEYRPQDRAIIFCTTKELCDEVAAALGIDAYHSDIDEDVRDESFKAFLAGTSGHAYAAIVATTMLTHGADVSSVRDVFWLNLPGDLFELWQSRGRGGRDGEPYRVTVYFNRHSRRHEDGNEFGERLVSQIALDDRHCRRIQPTVFLDGPGAGVTCATTPNAQLCDVCERALNEPAPAGRIAFPSELARPPARVSPLPVLSVPPRRDRQDAAAAPGPPLPQRLRPAAAAPGPQPPQRAPPQIHFNELSADDGDDGFAAYLATIPGRKIPVASGSTSGHAVEEDVSMEDGSYEDEAYGEPQDAPGRAATLLAAVGDAPVPEGPSVRSAGLAVLTDSARVREKRPFELVDQ